MFGAPGTIRTCDRLVRSQVLYPAELRALQAAYYMEADLLCQRLPVIYCEFYLVVQKNANILIFKLIKD